jgi:hypothetical protein
MAKRCSVNTEQGWSVSNAVGRKGSKTALSMKQLPLAFIGLLSLLLLAATPLPSEHQKP